MLSQKQQGLMACIASQFLWGVGILFWPMLSYLNAVSILSLRLICSFFFAVLVVYLTSRFDLVKSLFLNKKYLKISVLQPFFFVSTGGLIFMQSIQEKPLK